MVTFHKIISGLILSAVLTSCQFSSDANKALLDTGSRKEIVFTIANNNQMMEEMMNEILSSNNAKMMMQKNEKMLNMMLEDHASTVKIMKGNPALMHNIMSDMMEVFNSDTSAMISMCKTMMQNKPMMDMMQKMKTGDQGMPHKM